MKNMKIINSLDDSRTCPVRGTGQTLGTNEYFDAFPWSPPVRCLNLDWLTDWHPFQLAAASLKQLAAGMCKCGLVMCTV